MAKLSLLPGYLKAVRLYFTFGVKAAPNQFRPGADVRLMLSAAFVWSLCGWKQRVCPDEKITINTKSEFSGILVCHSLGEHTEITIGRCCPWHTFFPIHIVYRYVKCRRRRITCEHEHLMYCREIGVCKSIQRNTHLMPVAVASKAELGSSRPPMEARIRLRQNF